MSKKTPSETVEAFENEVFFSLRRQRNWGWAVGGLGMGIGLAAVVALLLTIPLKEVRPYVIMVDRATGESEQIVSVRPTTLADQQAVLEAELVRYVTNRETYDPNDNPQRIPLVDGMSQEQAQASLRAIWNSGSREYPPAIYGRDTLITTRVRSVSILDEDTAQVRFVRTLEKPGINPVSRDFVAVVGYAFNPRTERTLDQVWRNPLGFTVTSYRIDAETLDPRG
ncbi:MAG: type IV secretion system protein [Rhodobacterales bacterium]|nr:type IV secretion system protein [Rhodobacterales bacterium]